MCLQQEKENIIREFSLYDSSNLILYFKIMIMFFKCLSYYSVIQILRNIAWVDNVIILYSLNPYRI